MKTLKEYINEVLLTEGLLDIENNINYDISKDVIEEFLKENYNIKGAHTIKKTKDGFVVDVKGSIMVKNKDITSLTNEFFEFGSVSENFNCHACESLTSLQGAPKEVGGRFCCNWCNSLKNLEGAPKKVGGGGFDCAHCDNLTSLKGAPQKVDGGFDCMCCPSLTSLESAPKKVGGGFDCGHCKSLTSLIGAPKEVGGNFYCIYCESLRSLEGAPRKVGGYFCCNNCGVKFKTVEIKKYVKTAKYIRA